MKINVKKFSEVLKKATLFYLCDFTQLVLSKDKINCGITNQNKTFIIKLNLDNDIFIDFDKDKIELNIIDPGQTIIPYIQLFDKEIVDSKYTILRDDIIQNIKLSDKETKTSMKLNFAEPMITRIYKSSIKDDTQYLYEQDIDENFIDIYEKIKKISSRTNKIYFQVEKNKIYIEAGDKSVEFTNSVKIELNDVKGDDTNIFFDFKTFASALSVLDYGNKKYKFKLAVKNKKIGNEIKAVGIFYILSDDKSEEYFIASNTE